MSQDVRTRPTDSGDRESLDGLEGGPSVSPTDILERLWRSGYATDLIPTLPRVDG